MPDILRTMDGVLVFDLAQSSVVCKLTNENLMQMLRCDKLELSKLKKSFRHEMNEMIVDGKPFYEHPLRDIGDDKEDILNEMWRNVANSSATFARMLSGDRWGSQKPVHFEPMLAKAKHRILQMCRSCIKDHEARNKTLAQYYSGRNDASAGARAGQSSAGASRDDAGAEEPPHVGEDSDADAKEDAHEDTDDDSVQYLGPRRIEPTSFLPSNSLTTGHFPSDVELHQAADISIQAVNAQSQASQATDDASGASTGTTNLAGSTPQPRTRGLSLADMLNPTPSTAPTPPSPPPPPPRTSIAVADLLN